MGDEEKVPQAELTLEQLHGIETDPESEKKASQSVQLAKGTYNSVPTLSLKIGRSKTGRAYARYSGQFVGTGDVASSKGFGGFGISWEAVYKDDGKADLMTRLFNQAAKTYRLAMSLQEHEKVQVKDVLGYIEKYSVAVRFMQGDDDNVALSISRAKEA
jgi:hypothetical protein